MVNRIANVAVANIVLMVIAHVVFVLSTRPRFAPASAARRRSCKSSGVMVTVVIMTVAVMVVVAVL